jgi:hypothetical protein
MRINSYAVAKNEDIVRRTYRHPGAMDDMDEKLFDNILTNQDPLLSNLLPPTSVAPQNYDLRPRLHSQELPQHTGRLTDSNFITRILYKSTY